VNVGDYMDSYDDVPPNVHLAGWYPQPSVIPLVDAVIHHGGNNSFTECLYFGKPAIVMSYVWDGHDNGMRLQETGHGFRMDRYEWTDEELLARIETMLTDPAMKDRLAKISAHMQSKSGPEKAADLLVALAEGSK
jgi:UDP:flavonoid glycosyltransferase YjiC (YdhE family)